MISKGKRDVKEESEELRSVVERIEAKLEQLEAERDKIKHRVDVKRAQVRELEKTLESLRELESNLQS